MPDRTIIRLVPRDTPPARPVGPAAGSTAEPPLATVTPFPAAGRPGRVIRPLEGASLGSRRERFPCVAGLDGQPPGRLARALMELQGGR
jgi:hypothetical protein